jgi:hypothetical protein
MEVTYLDLLPLVLDLLGGGVLLLFPLLRSSSETKDEVEGRLLLDVVVRKGSAILELLTGEDKSLLVRGDSLLVLDLFRSKKKVQASAQPFVLKQSAKSRGKGRTLALTLSMVSEDSTSS